MHKHINKKNVPKNEKKYLQSMQILQSIRSCVHILYIHIMSIIKFVYILGYSKPTKTME